MSCFLRGLVELDRAVHDAVVGQADGRLAERGGALGELVDLARAVEQRVLGVDVEMRDGRGAHGEGTIGVAGGRKPARPLRPRSRTIAGNVASTSRSACAAWSTRAGSTPTSAGRALSPGVWAAAAEANATWASMDELLDASGRADRRRCAAPRRRGWCPGASAGIALSVAACIARGDGRGRWRRCRRVDAGRADAARPRVQVRALRDARGRAGRVGRRHRGGAGARRARRSCTRRTWTARACRWRGRAARAGRGRRRWWSTPRT